MGGGLMQLVAMGAQDVFLTGNPQITFFKVVYRRHTNFSKECIKQQLTGSIPSTGNSSGNVSCTLARNGDLVQEIYLKATVNAIDTTVPIDINNFNDGILLGINNPLVKNDQIIYFNKSVRKVQSVATSGSNSFVDIEITSTSINLSPYDRLKFNIIVGLQVENSGPDFIIPATYANTLTGNNDLITGPILNYINTNSNLITAIKKTLASVDQLQLETKSPSNNNINITATPIKSGPFTVNYIRQSSATQRAEAELTIDMTQTINKDDKIKITVTVNNTMVEERIHTVLQDAVDQTTRNQFIDAIVLDYAIGNTLPVTYSRGSNSLVIVTTSVNTTINVTTEKLDATGNRINLPNIFLLSNIQTGSLGTPIQYENVFESGIKYKIKNLSTIAAGNPFEVSDINNNLISFTMPLGSGGLRIDDLDVSSIGNDLELSLDSSSLDKDISNIIETVEVEIGGQKIDKHYSKWFDIYNELFETNHDYRRMLTRGAPGNDRIVYIPLRFWFNRNAGLALPLIALQYHEVKILMNLKVPSNSTLKNANLLVNYVYLDTDERRRFAQVSHEYLIEQVQHTGVESIDGSSSSGRVDMNFNHPIKALFWNTNGKNYLTNVKIQLNGHDRFIEQGADYFHLVQPYECGLGNGHSLDPINRTWSNVGNCDKLNSVGMYSFCLKPGEHQPSGSCNFSRIDNARLNYAPGEQSGASDDDNLYLFALNYNVLRIMSGMGGLTYSN